jgi:hypothetical protein
VRQSYIVAAVAYPIHKAERRVSGYAIFGMILDHYCLTRYPHCFP